MAKKEKQLDAFEIALSAVAAPYTFVLERLEAQDAAKINGNTRVLTVPLMEDRTLLSLASRFVKRAVSSARFDHVVINDCKSHYDGKLIGHTITFW